jgi:hypothetical protein
MGDYRDDKTGSSSRDLLEELFMDSDSPKIDDTDEALETPVLTIDMDDINEQAQAKAKSIVDRLSNYSFDPKYIEEHPYIPNKIAQELDNIRRLLKMLAVNEKAQDTLIMSISMNAGKGTLYGSLTSLQNSMLQMQSQLSALISNVETIFRDMQENAEKVYGDEEENEENDGSIMSKSTKEFIESINRMIELKKNAEAEEVDLEKEKEPATAIL